jgi:hypothetical protein
MIVRLLSPVVLLGILAAPCLAQTQDPPPAQTSTPAATSSSSTPASTPPKKVWTNENMPEGKGGVSVVGDKRNPNSGPNSAQPADAATATGIKKSLEKLQSQLDDVNTKLKSYKDFQDGEAVSNGERDLSKTYSRVPVDQQMAQLLDKKKQLEGQIGDLLDEARKKGVLPGQLR